MPDERETMLEGLKDDLASASGAAFAGRNPTLVLTGQIPEYPALFVIDAGDIQIEEDGTAQGQKRVAKVAIGCATESTSAANVPGDLSAFVRAVRKRLWQTWKTHANGMFETGLSPVHFIDNGPNRAYREIQIELWFIESLTDLINE